MCTVSWAKRPNGFSLYFNRDESRERPVALPPERVFKQGVSYICPRDPLGGGTWLLVNQYGMALGLLNYYEAEMGYLPESPRTRGEIPIHLAGCKTLKEVNTRVYDEDLSRYPPFHLLAVNREASGTLFTWDGFTSQTRAVGQSDLPISTSSFETKTVLERRRKHYQQTVLPNGETDEALEIFHKSKQPKPDTHAVLMTRINARTVSLSHVNVNASTITLAYRSRPDDSDHLDAPIQQSLEVL